MLGLGWPGKRPFCWTRLLASVTTCCTAAFWGIKETSGIQQRQGVRTDRDRESPQGTWLSCPPKLPCLTQNERASRPHHTTQGLKPERGTSEGQRSTVRDPASRDTGLQRALPTELSPGAEFGKKAHDARRTSWMSKSLHSALRWGAGLHTV